MHKGAQQQRCEGRTLRAWLETGGHEGKPLAPKTVRHAHVVLRKALADAERMGVVSRNAAAAARPPTGEHAEMTTWASEDLRDFLAAIEGHQYEIGFRLLAATGLRRGEVLGLRWRGGLAGAPATSTRAANRGWAGLGRRSRLAAHRRARWIRAPAVDVVRVAQAIERLDLPRIRLHDLRHTHATLALKAGVHPKVVSERLGHAPVGITLDLYSHVVPALTRDAAEQIMSSTYGHEQ